MCTLINMFMIVLIEHVKKLEDTALPEHIHKCKLTIHIDYMCVVGQ